MSGAQPHPAASTTPGWVRELTMALPIYPQILLVGNVRDEYHLPTPHAPEATAIYSLETLLARLLEEQGYAALATHDIATDHITTTRLHDEATLAPTLASGPGWAATLTRSASGLDFPHLRQVLTELTANLTAAPTALLFPFADRLTTPGERQPESARLFFSAADALAHRARRPIVAGTEQPYNTVLWIAERLEDLPAAFATTNPRIRQISVPHPSAEERLVAARRAVRIITTREPDLGASPTEQEQAAEHLASATHGMQATQVAAIGQLAAHQRIGINEITDAARLYRVGVTDNPWRDPQVLKRISEGEQRLNARVRGQHAAVRKTMDIFMRSTAGLTGAHAGSSPNRPRGVLVLSGPTGVGKTELAKGIAELILGTDAEPIRFDMSEFASEHARDRLIGAPPGYVGFDAGGELTNAVRAHPISVLLFDEIDKANPALFDLFLQILEDGRLTDGRGAVVHFTECVLVFTTNLGVVGPTGRLTRHDEPEQVRAQLTAAFEDFLDHQLGRPELRNRFGDSFVAMDFITTDIADEILDAMLDTVTHRVRRVHELTVTIGAHAREVLRTEAHRNLDDGGRGIGTVVETCLTNPLSRHLFHHPPQPRQQLHITALTHDGIGWSVEVQHG
ncbi:AAA family ATPase [Lipingzhangella sp. LS1_29]|uniref:AAA family ATPase n=1 Tax=Lipingzhangella rawalii TaxID=2055835 RepID=A0ABU2H2A6_9ACTN|nr:AAA family ATPase [Lipingzhangella rawalii]MDS1269132.1 AAA family ATPase [Lipingzhangella rawalii]